MLVFIVNYMCAINKLKNEPYWNNKNLLCGISALVLMISVISNNKNENLSINITVL